MRWTPGDRGNIEDLRGRSGIGMRAGGLGIGGLLVVLLLSWATGIDFLSLVGNGGGAPSETVGTYSRSSRRFHHAPVRRCSSAVVNR